MIPTRHLTLFYQRTSNITRPCTVIAKVAVSNAADVEAAVSGASTAFASWSGLTMKARAGIMLKFYSLVKAKADVLAECIVKEVRVLRVRKGRAGV